MKTIFVILMFFSSISINAKDIGHSESDTIACMRQIVCDSLSFKGKAVGEVFKRFKEMNIPIRSISFGGTSAWIDPDAKSYVNSIVISFYTDDEIVYRCYQEQPFAIIGIFTTGPKMTIEEALGTFSIRNRQISIEEKINMISNVFGVKHLHFVYYFNKAASLPQGYYDWLEK